MDIGSRRSYPKRGLCIFTWVPRGWCFDEKYLSVCTHLPCSHVFFNSWLNAPRLFRCSHCSKTSVQWRRYNFSFDLVDRGACFWPLSPPTGPECPQLITTPVKHTLTSVTFLSPQFVPVFVISLEFLTFQMKTSQLLL